MSIYISGVEMPKDGECIRIDEQMKAISEMVKAWMEMMR